MNLSFFCIRKRVWYPMKTESLKDIWNPVYYFVNGVKVEQLGSFGGDSTESLWYKNPHTLWYSSVNTVTVTCDFNFETFPHDEHTCYLKMRNWLGVSDYVLANKPLIFNGDGIPTEQYKITSPKLVFDVTFTAKNSTEYNQFGWSYSMAIIEIGLKRNQRGLQNLLRGYFVSTGIFGATSIISFFITPGQVSGRMGMLVTLYLILINTYNSIDAPKSRGFSFVDFWFLGCQFPIAFAIIQYGTLLAWTKFQKSKVIDYACAAISAGFFSIFIILYWIISLR